MKRITSLLANTTLILCGLALAFLLGETTVRLLSEDSASQGFYQRSSTRSYELKPNAEFISPLGVRNRVNSLGLPDEEIPSHKEDRELRILVLGDSCTHNIDVPRDKRFTTLINERLAKAFPERYIRVINAGVTGYNIMQIMTLYGEVGKSLEPDCVVLHYVLTDSFRRSLVNQTFLELPGWVQEIILSVYDASALVRWLRTRLQTLVTKNHLVELGSMDSFLSSRAWALTKDSIISLRNDLAKQGKPLVVMVYTYLNDIEAFAPYYTAVEIFCRQNGIPVASTWRLLANRQGNIRELWVSPGDAHPNAEANAIIAEELEPMLLDTLERL